MSHTGKSREGYFDSQASVPWTATHRQNSSISPIPQRLSVNKDKHKVHPSFRNENQMKIGIVAIETSMHLLQNSDDVKSIDDLVFA